LADLRLNVDKIWERLTDINKANEQIENTWEVLRQVIDSLGHDHWRTLTQKAHNQGRWQRFNLASNVEIVVEELNAALRGLQERDEEIQRLRSRIATQETDLRGWAVKHRDESRVPRPDISLQVRLNHVSALLTPFQLLVMFLLHISQRGDKLSHLLTGFTL
jgi:chromosome segregation ATPase